MELRKSGRVRLHVSYFPTKLICRSPIPPNNGRAGEKQKKGTEMNKNNGFGSKEHVAALRKGIEVSKSGFGGMLPNGNIVDRREHPEAIPIAKNSMFGVPEPNAQADRTAKAGERL